MKRLTFNSYLIQKIVFTQLHLGKKLIKKHKKYVIQILMVITELMLLNILWIDHLKYLVII